MGSALDRDLAGSSPPDMASQLDSDLGGVQSPPGSSQLDMDLGGDGQNGTVAPTMQQRLAALGPQIVQSIKEQGYELAQFFKYSLRSPGGQILTSGLTSTPLAQQALGGGIEQDMLDAHGGDQEALHRVHRGIKGGAFVASSVVSGGVGGAISEALGAGVARTGLRALATRAASYTAAEALGGATYGTLRPLEPGETRTGAVVGDAAAFPILSGIFHGAFKVAGHSFVGFSKLAEPIFKRLADAEDAGIGRKVADRAAAIAKEMTVDAGGHATTAEAQRIIQNSAIAQALDEVMPQRPNGLNPMERAGIGERSAEMIPGEGIQMDPNTQIVYSDEPQGVDVHRNIDKATRDPFPELQGDRVVNLPDPPKTAEQKTAFQRYDPETLYAGYAQQVLKEGSEIQRIRLVGSSVSGSGKDVDLVYELNIPNLPADEANAASKIIEVIEKHPSWNPDEYDTFVKVGDRYFHLSEGAGRDFVENTAYGLVNDSKPSIVLADRSRGNVGNEVIPKGISHDDILSMARTGDETVGAGFDKSLLKKLGAKMYEGDIGSVVTKEGLQNAVDAVRGIPGGKVKIDIKQRENLITITDNGTGMSPEVAANEFMDVGGSAKGAGASGGYGLAKVGILSSAEHFTMQTVADTPKGRMLTVITGSGDDWAAGTLKYESTKVSNEFPTGTRLSVKVDGEAKPNWYKAEEFLRRTMKQNKGDIGLEISSNGTPLKQYATDPKAYGFIDEPVFDKPVETHDLPGAKLDIYESKHTLGDKEGPYGMSSQIEVHVLNRGVYQFTYNKSVKPTADMPAALTVDIAAKVPTDHALYPFTTSRENISGSEYKDVVATYIENITRHAIKRDIIRLSQELSSAPEMSTKGLRFYDTASNAVPEFIETVTKSPGLNKLAQAMDKVTTDVVEQVLTRLERAGRKTLPIFGGFGSQKEWLGINILQEALNKIAAEEKVSINLPNENLILVNPFATYNEATQNLIDAFGVPSARELAEQSWATIVHEVAHEISRGHDEHFAGTLTRFIGDVSKIADESIGHLEQGYEAAIQGGLDGLAKQANSFGAGKNKFGKISGHNSAELPPEDAQVRPSSGHDVQVGENAAEVSSTRVEGTAGNVPAGSEPNAAGNGTEVSGVGRLTAPRGSPLEADYQLEDVAREITSSAPHAEHGPLAETALTDAALDKAVAEMKTQDIMSETVKAQADAAKKGLDVLEPNAKRLGGENAEVRRLMEEALYEEDPGATLAQMYDRGPREVDFSKKPGAAVKRAASQLPTGPDKAPIEIDGPLTGIKPTWSEVFAKPVPETPNGAWTVLAKMTDDQLKFLEKEAPGFFKSELGGMSLEAASRLGLATGSGWMAYASSQQDDPTKRDLFAAASGFLALAAMVPGGRFKSWLIDSGWTRKVIKMFDIESVMAKSGSKEGLRAWQELSNTGNVAANLAKERLKKVFSSEHEMRAAMHVLDEGPGAPEFAFLSPEQQKEAFSEHQFNLKLGQLLQHLGILEDYKSNYVRHLLPQESFQRWRAQWDVLVKSGNFTKARQFETLREMEDWAKRSGLKGPIMDPSHVQAFHIIEAYRAIANRQLQSVYERLGFLQDLPLGEPVPEGWRQIKVGNLSKKMAPDEIASVFERAATTIDKFGIFKDAFVFMDQAKGAWMRSIMLWPWEHGLNVLRGALALDGTGISYSRALKQVSKADPSIMEAARWGVKMFDRPDFGQHGTSLFDKFLEKVDPIKSPTTARIIGWTGSAAERGEHALWNRTVPALGLASFNRYMLLWSRRTEGKFLPGSVEYTTAARAASDFANRVMGKVPDLLQDPAAAFFSRQLLFSPSWLRTRMSLTAHAAGDVQKILAGEINPRDAVYLQYKIRQVMLGAAMTYAISWLWTGKAPQFNPNTSKFYARTGIKDRKGREQGVDVIGWWQDDVKLFSDPFSFIRGRVAPQWKVVGSTINGRDEFGRPIQGAEKLEGIINSFGPIPEMITGGIQAAQHGGLNGAEALRVGSGAAAVGNVSSLPKPIDAAIGKIAGKLLRQAGLPDDSDAVWELSRMMRQNFSQSGSLYGEDVASWLAYKRRDSKHGHYIRPLWNEMRHLLRETTR